MGNDGNRDRTSEGSHQKGSRPQNKKGSRYFYNLQGNKMNHQPICQYPGCTDKGHLIINGMLIVSCDKHKEEIKEMLFKAQKSPEFMDLLTKYIQNK